MTEGDGTLWSGMGPLRRKACCTMSSTGDRLGRIQSSFIRHQKGWIVYTVSALLGAVLVGVGVIVQLSHGPHPAVAAVNGYLSALQEGDAKAAREFTDVSLLGHQPFLADDAIGGGWSVDMVALNGGFGAGSYAEVATVLSMPDGRESTGVFEVRMIKDGWTITNPYVSLIVAETPIAALGVNDHTSPVENDALTEYFVFPGVLSFDDVGSELVTRQSMDYLMVTGRIELGTDASGGHFELTDAGTALLQQKVDTLIDECTQNVELLTPGCPFGASHSRTDDNEPVTDLADVTWTVIEYPQVIGAPADGEFVVASRAPGVVELSGTGTDDTGEAIDVTIECTTVETTLRFTITAADDIELSHIDTPSGVNESEFWHTCLCCDLPTTVGSSRRCAVLAIGSQLRACRW